MQSKTEFMVAIYIYGRELVPETISEILGATPTKGWKTGETRIGKVSGHHVASKTGLWMLKAFTNSMRLDDHVSELIAKLEGRVTRKLKDLPGAEVTKLDVYVVQTITENRMQDFDFDIGSHNVLALGEMGLSLNFTIGSVDASEVLVTPDPVSTPRN